MIFKKLLTITLAIIGLTATSNGQVPNYVPINGLVGWWPFNGNANDESGNGNDGTVINAILTTDKFNLNNSAYLFSDNDSYIQLPSLSFNQYTFSCWIYDHNLQDTSTIFSSHVHHLSGDAYFYHEIYTGYFVSSNKITSTNSYTMFEPYSTSDSSWHFIAVSFDGLTINHYLDGSLINFGSSGMASILNYTGMPFISNPFTSFDGKIDDFGLWNRALSQQEIIALYNDSICTTNLSISPVMSQLQTGSTANFIATLTDPNPSFEWQSDFGQGYVSLNNYGNYSGVNTNSLSISNVQLSEHNQPIRVISTSGVCVDTSNVATISITDTCLFTINDTITTFISVTDTLIINTTITSLTPPNIFNTIQIFPNPTNDHITIDYGNFALMNGYQLTIENSLGQQVFQTNISQQNDYLTLSNWGGNGLYFVHIIDTQGNTIDIRKIILQ